MKIINEVKDEKNTNSSMLSIECTCGDIGDIPFSAFAPDVLITCSKCNSHTILRPNYTVWNNTVSPMLIEVKERAYEILNGHGAFEIEMSIVDTRKKEANQQ